MLLLENHRGYALRFFYRYGPIFSAILIWIFSSSFIVWGGHPRLSNVAFLEKPLFIGRDPEMRQLHEKLFTESGGASCVTVSGLEGVGKKAFVKNFLYYHKDQYDIIWWFDATKDLCAQYKVFLDKLLGLDKSFVKTNYLLPPIPLMQQHVIHEVKDFLRKTPLKWILIFQDVDEQINNHQSGGHQNNGAMSNKQSFENFLPEHHGDGIGHIIITSTADHASQNSIKLGELTSEESAEILRYFGELKNHEIDKYREYFGYPFVLIQLAMLIKNNPHDDCNQYLKLLNPDKKGDKNTIKEILHKELSNIWLKDMRGKNPLAYDILKYCVFFNENNIPEYFLRKIFVNDNLQLEKYHEAISVLTNYSLLKKIDRSSDNNPSDVDSILYSMDPILQSIVRDEITYEKTKILCDILKHMAQIFAEQKNHLLDYIENNLSFVDHVKKVLDMGKEIVSDSDDFIQLAIFLFESKMMLRDYEAAKDCLPLLKAIDEGRYQNNMMCCRYYRALARYELWKGDNHAAAEKAALAERCLDHPSQDIITDVFQTKVVSCVVFRHQILLSKVQAKQKELDDLIKKYGQHMFDPYLQDYLQEKAIMYYDQGDLSSALKIFDAVEKRVKNHPKNYNKIIYAIWHNFVRVMTGEHDKVLSIVKELEDDFMNKYDRFRSHMVYARIQLLKALALLKKDDLKNAFFAISESLKIQDSIYKTTEESYHKQRRQAISYVVLGDIHMRYAEKKKTENNITKEKDMKYIGDHFKTARAYYNKALDVYKTIHPGTQEIYIVALLYEKMIKNAIACNDEDYRNFYGELQEAYGPNHEITKRVRRYLKDNGK